MISDPLFRGRLFMGLKMRSTSRSGEAGQGWGMFGRNVREKIKKCWPGYVSALTRSDQSV